MMKARIINMSIIEIKTLEIKKFFEQDVLDFTKYPIEEIAQFFTKKFLKYRALDLTTIESEIKREEIRDLFNSIFTNGKPYTVKSKFTNYFFYLPELANKMVCDSFLDITVDDCKKLFQSIIEENNISVEADHIIPALIFELEEIRDTRIGTMRDVWYFKDFNIDESRFNKSVTQSRLNFKLIHNVQHREVFKSYFKYLIGCTELAISTIMNMLPLYTAFSNYYTEINIFDITSDDITNYIGTIIAGNNVKNKLVNDLSNFYKYCAIKEMTDKESPVLKTHLQKDKYVPADNLVSENVILQIFKNLHDIDLQHKCIYLINYCTGMRISDICLLKLDCLYYDNDGGYYIRFFNQKMQKQLMNLIPHSLYLLIQEQQGMIRPFNYENSYLFPSDKDKSLPTNSSSYRQFMRRWCKNKNIKNDDGTDYKYTTHSYRHSLATDLFQNYDVDLQIIQLAVLGHQEIQMSLTYAQRDDNFNKAKHDKYITNFGEFQPLDMIDLDADGLQKKALTDGYCNYPHMLGICPNADICLSCEFFRTSVRFLDVHRKHLAEVRKNIVLYRTNNWIHNLATALETEQRLVTIIQALEDIKAGNIAKGGK